jgi:alginate O-acetyltransferase complex protein AlgI
MLFNSFQYLIFFALVMLGAKLLTSRNFQHLFLTLASLYFYAAWNSVLVLVIVASASLDFWFALKMGSATSLTTKRKWLVLSLLSNLGLLGFFKYTNFLLDSLFHLQSWMGLDLMREPIRLNIILPVGISFYTFQTLSYTIDVYREKLAPTRSFREFLLFISFFPQLVAGPIIRAADFLPQLRRRAELVPNNLKVGFTFFLAGLVKKVVFADSLGVFVEKIYSEPTHYSSIPIILATAAYAVQIYCDFSGYTDMAIGSATALGFWLPKNFNYPYLAPNVTQFWQRWHISLSTWLRDYLYIPLGGNRKGVFRTYLNLGMVMLLGGLWHGARWNFVLWGAYQGCLLALHRFYDQSVQRSTALAWLERWRTSKPFYLFSVFVTFYLILIGWIFFRAQNLQDLGYLLSKFVIFDGFHQRYGLYLREVLAVVVLLVVFTLFHFMSYRVGVLASFFSRARDRAWCCYVTAGFLLLMLMAPSRSPEFIYFQF